MKLHDISLGYCKSDVDRLIDCNIKVPNQLVSITLQITKEQLKFALDNPFHIFEFIILHEPPFELSTLVYYMMYDFWCKELHYGSCSRRYFTTRINSFYGSYLKKTHINGKNYDIYCVK